MKQSKFSLADVLTLLTALAFSYICFLGMNFYALGDFKQSIILSVIIAVLLFVTAFAAKLFKRTNRNFKTNFILEMVMLVLFTGLTIFFAYSPFPHFFNVSEKKTEIQNKLQTSITQAENMFAKYESYVENRKNLYEHNLQSVAAAKGINPSDYANYGFVSGSVSDDVQIKNKMFTIHADLFPSDYSDSISRTGIKEVATDWLANAKSTTSDWKPIGVVKVVNEVDANSQNWLSQLKGFSQTRQNGEIANDFDHELSFDDVKTHFTTLGKPTPLSIGLAVGAYLLMLLSWFVTKRSSKRGFSTAPYEIEL